MPVEKCVRVDLKVSGKFYREIVETFERTGSAEEVVLVVPRPGEKALLHTKSFYPAETYRLPTGRMHPGEEPDAAFAREYREELGGVGEIDRRFGVVVYTLVSDAGSAEFRSYVYLTRELVGEPHPQDGDEEITGFIDVPFDELPTVAESLRNLPGDWRDWGRFRAVVHDFVVRLRDKPV